jgi:hypothetical protein
VTAAIAEATARIPESLDGPEISGTGAANGVVRGTSVVRLEAPLGAHDRSSSLACWPGGERKSLARVTTNSFAAAPVSPAGLANQSLSTSNTGFSSLAAFTSENTLPADSRCPESLNAGVPAFIGTAFAVPGAERAASCASSESNAASS